MPVARVCRSKLQKGEFWPMTSKVTRFTALAALGIIIFALTACAQQEEEPRPLRYDAPPPMTIDTGKSYTATIQTNKGNMVCELFPADAPVTVNSFVFLSREGFYDGVTFHRVIPGFMAQGGDPTGTGSGGPGYQFQDEFSDRAHGTGALSMANAGPNTNGSQFFITHAPQPHLDGAHSVFGQLIEGMDVLLKIEQGDVIKTIMIDES